VFKRNALVLLIALCAVACSKKEAAEQRPGADADAPSESSEAALNSVRRAMRVWSKERPTVEVVAAELEGVIMARTTAQVLMHYPGYRIILTTPGEVVTRIVFQFDDDAKPSIIQLTGLFGEPKAIQKGMLYTQQNVTTGQTINILAQPVTMPAEDVTLVKGLIIEGARTR